MLGIAVGFTPYVDNFAHLGGLLMGLLFGMILYPIISRTPRHKLIVWVLRIAAIPLAIVLYVVLIRNFYKSDPYAGTYDSKWRVYNILITYSLLLVPLPVVHPYQRKQSMQGHW